MLTVWYRPAPWLGDNLFCTAVLENLYATGKFSINIPKENHPQVWQDCPFLDKSVLPETADYRLKQHSDTSWKIGCPHIIEGTTKALEQDLGIDIPVVCKVPKIYSQIPDGRLVEEKYILINTGWQSNAETKRWSSEYWKELIASMSEYKFVQMGQSKNHARPIDGCIDMIDKTDFLQLCQLVRDAECVVSPPSGVIHIAGALGKAFVSIAGGREAATVASYPSGKVRCKVGGHLNCCRSHGCRRGFFDRSPKCKKQVTVTGDRYVIGKCMQEISPKEVKQDIIEVMAQ